jgi:tetratricopeptide (TPR) repeat protein
MFEGYFTSGKAALERILAGWGVGSPWALGLFPTLALVCIGFSLLCLILFLYANLRSTGPRILSRRALLRRARKALTRKAFAEAGGLFLAAREFQEAAKAFVTACDFKRAAEACLALGDHKNAAQCFARIPDQERAAEHYLKAREYIPAAESFLAVGLLQEAARLFIQGGDLPKAAECHIRMGLWRKGAEAAQAAGDHLEAGRLLLRALEERAGRRDPALSPAEDALTRNLAREAALALDSGGQKGKAAEVLEQGGLYREAAAAFERGGDRHRASQLYLKAGDTSSAARIFETSDRPQDLSSTGTGVAEVLEREGRLEEAADLFFRVGDFTRAAAIYRKTGMAEKALAAYRRAGDAAAAADMLVSLERHAEAAEELFHAGRFEEAARIYRRLGDTQKEIDAQLAGRDFLGAGARLLEIGRSKEALDALQQVEPTHPRYAEAARALGDIFYSLKQWPLAISNFQRAMGDEVVRRETLGTHYLLALALKEDGQYQGAAAVMEKILMVDYHYRDAQAALQNLREMMKAASASAAGAMPKAGPEATMVAGRGPARVRRYQIIEELGRGGMGVVYKVRDTTLDRVVAYKVLPPQVQGNPKAIELFLREAKAAARLSHPNIVAIYDAAEENGEYFIVMEFVEGKSLKEMVEKQGPLPVRAGTMISVQLFKGLAYAHDKGIIHRDIKPANLLWASRERQVKITDFGLARAFEEGKGTLTQMTGTPFYMAPEQIVGGAVDHRVDLYSAGATLYELFTGTVPFREGDVLYHHVHTAPRPPRELNTAIPNSLSDLILRCLEKKPEARFASVENALEELKRTLH